MVASKREAWRQYACAALMGDDVDVSSKCADTMTTREEERFGPFESAEHAADDVRTYVTLGMALAGEAPSGTWVRAQPDGDDTVFTGEIVRFDDYAYLVRESMTGGRVCEWVVSPHNVLAVVSSDPETREAVREAQRLTDDVRTLEEHVRVLTAELAHEREQTEFFKARIGDHKAELQRMDDRCAQLRAQLASAVPADCVPVGDLRALAAEWLKGLTDPGTPLQVRGAAELRDCANQLLYVCNEAEQRARAGEGVGDG
jgi:hypothetical protein